MDGAGSQGTANAQKFQPGPAVHTKSHANHERVNNTTAECKPIQAMEYVRKLKWCK